MLTSCWLSLPLAARAQVNVTSLMVGPSTLVGGSMQEATLTVTVDTVETTSVWLSATGVNVEFISTDGQPVNPLEVSGGSGTCKVRANAVAQVTSGSIHATATNFLSHGITVTPLLSSLSLGGSSIVGGSTDEATGTVQLAAAARANTSASLSSAPGGLTFAHNGQPTSNITILAGSSSAIFTVYKTTFNSTTINYNVSVNVAGKIESASLSATPITHTFSISPSTIAGNDSDQATGTVATSASVRSLTAINLSTGGGLSFWYNGVAVTWAPIQAGSSSVTFGVKAGVASGIVTRTAYASLLTSLSHAVTVYGPGPKEMGPQACDEDCYAQAGKPINLSNGNVWLTQRDFSLPGLGGGLTLARTWNSLWVNNTPVETSGMFGHSWRSTYEERLASGTPLRYWHNDGAVWQFQYDSVNQAYILLSPAHENATLTFDSGTTLYTLTLPDGGKKIFNNGGYLTKLIDRNNNQTTITYDGSNRITQVTDAAGRSASFTYSGAARQALTMADATGTIATYQYDATLRLTKVTYADASFITFTYDLNNLLLNVKDSQGKVLEAHTYDSQRRGLTSEAANGVEKVTVAYVNATLTRVTDSHSNVSDYNHAAYNSGRRITGFSGSGCFSCGGRGVASFGYDFKGRRTASTDGLNRTTTYTYDVFDNVASRAVTLVPGTILTWSYTYNNRGQVLTATDAMGKVTTNTYDGNGNLLSTRAPSPDGAAAGPLTSFTYDTKGQLLTVTDPRNHTTTIAYNAAGLIASVTEPAPHSGVTSYGYDARSNRTSVTDALGKTTTFTYDVMNRLAQITAPSPDGVAPQPVTTFAYDSRGRRTSVTDANNKTTSYAYDDADRLLTATDAASNVTTYTYDTENNLTKIKDALLRETQFAYHPRGWITQVTFPSGLSESYSYDAIGNLISKTDRKGQTFTYTYDALDRLSQKQYPDSSGVDYAYDHLDRLIEVSDATGTYAFEYDNIGRLIEATTNYAFLPSRALLVSYTYDAASNRLSMTDAEGGVTAYAYDNLDRLTMLTPPAAFSSGSFGFTYDTLSRRIALTRPNNVITEFAYDHLSRLLSVQHKLGANTIDGASYTLDAVGNRTARTELPSNITSNYTYDPLYQLTQVVKNAVTTETYSYDAVGNRLSSLGVNPYSYNSSNHLTSIAGTPNTTFTYDNNGNTLTKVGASGTTTYAWDFENRLTSVTLPASGGTVSFAYDPLGRRIRKVSSAGTSIYVFDMDNLVEELTSSGTVAARHLHSREIDEPLATLRSGSTHAYQADGRGSITSLSNSAGTIVSTYAYDEFGNSTASTGTVVNSFSYAARELDGETGLYYNRFRYLDTTTGRFLNEDPIEFEAGINFYTYVLSNPVRWIDPLGLQHDSLSATERQILLKNDSKAIEIYLDTVKDVIRPAAKKLLQERIKQLRAKACDLIRGKAKRSKSYHSELENKTYEELLKDPSQAARQMRKLIEESKRLSEKGNVVKELLGLLGLDWLLDDEE